MQKIVKTYLFNANLDCSKTGNHSITFKMRISSAESIARLPQIKKTNLLTSGFSFNCLIKFFGFK